MPPPLKNRILQLNYNSVGYRGEYTLQSEQPVDDLYLFVLLCGQWTDLMNGAHIASGLRLNFDHPHYIVLPRINFFYYG